MLQGQQHMCVAVDASHANIYISAALNNTEHCFCNKQALSKGPSQLLHVPSGSAHHDTRCCRSAAQTKQLASSLLIVPSECPGTVGVTC